MRYLLCSVLLLGFAVQSQASMVITGVIDGPLTGGTPKAIEFYVGNDIADLSNYGFGTANNGDGSDGEEFAFPAVAASAGDFIRVTTSQAKFTEWFGVAADYISGFAGVNGDDAVELYMGGSVIDVFGDINVDGTGQPWEYMDGWAYRKNNTGPDGTSFAVANWNYSGVGALTGEATNGTAATPFPIGTYQKVPEPSAFLFVGLLGCMAGGLSYLKKKKPVSKAG